MTQNEIIEMAIQAGLIFNEGQGTEKARQIHLARVEAFAKLVAAKEREACAKSLEDSAETATNFQAKVLIEWCATHIRARGEA